MQELEDALTRVHPDTLTGALIYAVLMVLLGILGSLAIRGAARRALPAGIEIPYRDDGFSPGRCGP